VPIPPSAPGPDRGLLRDDVHRRLRDTNVDGTSAPREQLRDLALAAWPGASRTPVREALPRLAQSGLVQARRAAPRW
jgi:DNA-binding GntR family transcriptional regulator